MFHITETLGKSTDEKKPLVLTIRQTLAMLMRPALV
jgi:hypothetical protein